MPVHYRVSHLTRYDYAEIISGSRHLAHLTPRNTAWQQVLHHAIDIQPPPVERATRADYFGNQALRFTVGSAHECLQVLANSIVEVRPQATDWAPEQAWEAALATGVASTAPHLDVDEFRLASPAVPLLPEATAFVRASLAPRRPLQDALRELALRVQHDFAYDPDATSVRTTLDDFLRLRRGVCQDFTHFLLSGLRGMGFAARYLSGYVAPLSGGGGLPAAHQGAAASHAWLAVHAPGIGWIGCDPTNGKLADTEFITLAWGRDFTDVTPLRGVILARGPQRLTVNVRVEEIAAPGAA